VCVARIRPKPEAATLTKALQKKIFLEIIPLLLTFSCSTHQESSIYYIAKISKSFLGRHFLRRSRVWGRAAALLVAI